MSAGCRHCDRQRPLDPTNADNPPTSPASRMRSSSCGRLEPMRIAPASTTIIAASSPRESGMTAPLSRARTVPTAARKLRSASVRSWKIGKAANCLATGLGIAGSDWVQVRAVWWMRLGMSLKQCLPRISRPLDPKRKFMPPGTRNFAPGKLATEMVRIKE